MELKIRRTGSACLLLAVFLPMLLLSSVHTHGCGAEGQEVCQECTHHKVHNSHLTKASLSMHECVLCKLLQVTYLTPDPLCASVPQRIGQSPMPGGNQRVVVMALRTTTPRAPPVV